MHDGSLKRVMDRHKKVVDSMKQFAIKLLHLEGLKLRKIETTILWFKVEGSLSDAEVPCYGYV